LQFLDDEKAPKNRKKIDIKEKIAFLQQKNASHTFFGCEKAKFPRLWADEQNERSEIFT
jgi:hypothetical protein